MRAFITGITGTLGTALARLHLERGDGVAGCARDEARAKAWAEANPALASCLTLKDAFLLDDADVGCDVLYHCAAMKHVDMCERHPAEAVRQNVELTRAVLTVCKRSGVRAVHVSSDKACQPSGVYGATKLISERIACELGFPAVRLGNLIGSSGSVLERWARQAKEGKPIQVTDPEMTRFFLPVRTAAEFLAKIVMSVGLGVVAPWPMRAVRIGELAEWFGKVEVVGRRPGESLHQLLASADERWVPFEDRIMFGIGKSCVELSSRDAVRWALQELMKEVGP